MLKIEVSKERKSAIVFSDLKQGDVFKSIDDGEYYIKIDLISVNIGYPHDSQRRNALDKHGNVVLISFDEKVIKVDAKLVVSE